MNHKEKLIEIINNVIHCDKCGIVPEWLAEDLISRGVTVQDVPDNNVGKWISVKDRLPEVGEEVLTYCKENKNKYTVGTYSDTYKGFFVNQFWNGDITHWCYLPQPPKGE